MPATGCQVPTVPARPRWLLALPDAIAQLDALDRPLLTRRDLESLFGVSRALAATLMRTFGAELTGSIRTLPRTTLLRQLRRLQQNRPRPGRSPPPPSRCRRPLPQDVGSKLLKRKPARCSPESPGYFESHSAYACTSIIGTVPLN